MISSFLALAVKLNFTDFNATHFINNLWQIPFDPFLALFGNIFWGIFFGFIGGALYVGSEKSKMLIFGYLVIIGLIFAVLLPFAVAGIMVLVLALIASSAVFKTFVESR